MEVCKCCGTKILWSGRDDRHGLIWGCDECMEYFCEKCFEDRHGQEALREMLRDDGQKILCPDCYEKDKEGN